MTSENLPLAVVPDKLPEFVDGVLLQFLTGTQRDKATWCPQWRDHPEAVHRLEAVRVQWTRLLGEEISLHEFMRDVLDYHLPMLVDADKGTFRGCSYGHTEHKRLDAENPATNT